MLEPTREKIEKIISMYGSLHIYIVGECPEIPVALRKKVSWWNLGTTIMEEKIRYIKRGLATGSKILMDTELDQIMANSRKINENSENNELNENSALNKLKSIHSQLRLTHGTFNEEFPEQLMVTRYLTGNEKVLELGGNIGRNSLIISWILSQNNNTSLVVVESDTAISKMLEENRALNDASFQIENAALSKRKLVQRGWNTIISDVAIDGYKPVNTITLQELNMKYNIPFDTLIIDCEGAFYYILKDMPEILNNIKLIITENDYKDIEHKNYIDNILKLNGFYVEYSEKGSQEAFDLKFPCYLNFYEVWKRN
jgi:FkbM family methyltransferase